MRLVDADAILEELKTYLIRPKFYSPYDTVENAPTVDAQPVVRGEWILDEERSKDHVEKIYHCSSCHNCEAWGEEERSRFCPWCGAKMSNGFFPHDEVI